MLNTFTRGRISLRSEGGILEQVEIFYRMLNDPKPTLQDRVNAWLAEKGATIEITDRLQGRCNDEVTILTIFYKKSATS